MQFLSGAVANIARPDIIVDAHLDFIRAGAQVCASLCAINQPNTNVKLTCLMWRPARCSLTTYGCTPTRHQRTGDNHQHVCAHSLVAIPYPPARLPAPTHRGAYYHDDNFVGFTHPYSTTLCLALCLASTTLCIEHQAAAAAAHRAVELSHKPCRIAGSLPPLEEWYAVLAEVPPPPPTPVVDQLPRKPHDRHSAGARVRTPSVDTCPSCRRAVLRDAGNCSGRCCCCPCSCSHRYLASVLSNAQVILW